MSIYKTSVVITLTFFEYSHDACNLVLKNDDDGDGDGDGDDGGDGELLLF